MSRFSIYNRVDCSSRETEREGKCKSFKPWKRISAIALRLIEKRRLSRIDHHPLLSSSSISKRERFQKDKDSSDRVVKTHWKNIVRSFFTKIHLRYLIFIVIYLFLMPIEKISRIIHRYDKVAIIDIYRQIDRIAQSNVVRQPPFDHFDRFRFYFGGSVSRERSYSIHVPNGIVFD